jgi:hypothetical protein
MTRSLVRLPALNRMLFGVGYLIAPGRMGGAWVGRQASKPQIHVLTRALGARDLVLGLGALVALSAGEEEARRWFTAHALADGTDLVATVIAREKLPSNRFRFATGMAGASTAIAVLGAARPARASAS